MGGKTREVGVMSPSYCLVLCFTSFVFSTFSVFKDVYHEYPFAFSVISVMQ